MQVRQWPWVGLAPLVLIGAVLLPTAAMGQVTLGQLIPRVEKETRPPAEGFYLTPSLSIGQLYDDNIFFSQTNRQQDFFTRISPGIQAGYQSTPLMLLGGYTFDSEFYSKHPEIDTIQMRQRALIKLKAMPTELLTFSADGTYSKTRAPWELNTFTGVAIRRVIADRIAFEPSMAYRLDPITTATGEYTFSRDRVVGGTSINSNIVRLGLDRRISTMDTVTTGYIGRQFEFVGVNTVTSHAFTLGWTHRFTPLTTLTVRAGPRVTEGSLDESPEALVFLHHRLTNGELSLTYSNIQTTVIGTPARLITQSVGGSAAYELLPHLELRLSPNVMKITSENVDVTVYLTDAALTYQLTKWLALKASHQFSFQQGHLSGAPEAEIRHNISWFRLVINYPYRLQ